MCARTLEEAFVDLRALMAKAAEMVSMAERYRVALASQASASLCLASCPAGGLVVLCTFG